jgi:signal transduction histidine kinase
LRWLVGNVPSGPSLTVGASIPEIDHLVPRAHWIGAYRAGQEALTNAVKHAKATALSLDIRPRGDAIDFTVEDDGQGFEPERAAGERSPPPGLGLRTLAQRISLIGGAVEVRSGEGRGTRITFSIPVAREGAV